MPTILEPAWLNTHWEWSLAGALVVAYVLASVAGRRSAARDDSGGLVGAREVAADDEAPAVATVRSRVRRRFFVRYRAVAFRRSSCTRGRLENRECGCRRSDSHPPERDRNYRRGTQARRVPRRAPLTVRRPRWSRRPSHPGHRNPFASAIEARAAESGADADQEGDAAWDDDRMQVDQHPGERRVVFSVRVTSDTPRALLERIPGTIREIVRAQSDTRFDRSHFVNIGAASLDFETVYYVLSSDYFRFLAIQHAIFCEVKAAFKRDGIRLAYPN